MASTDDIEKTNDAAYDDNIKKLQNKTKVSANPDTQIAIQAAVEFMQNNRPGGKAQNNTIQVNGSLATVEDQTEQN